MASSSAVRRNYTFSFIGFALPLRLRLREVADVPTEISPLAESCINVVFRAVSKRLLRREASFLNGLLVTPISSD